MTPPYDGPMDANGSDPRYPDLRTVVGDLAVWLAVGGVLGGLVLGGLAVREERYLRHGMSFLALAAVKTRVWETLFAGIPVLGVSATVFAAGRLAFRRLRGWPGLGLFLLLSAAAVHFLGLYAPARIGWGRLGVAEKVLVLLGLGIAVERTLIPGRLGKIPGRIPRAAAAVLLLLVPVGLSAAVQLAWAGRAERVGGRPSFLFLVVDALRADHVGALGYGRDTTPAIDRLAERGYLFTNAVSNSIATRFTVPSIFTMVFPRVHGIVVDGQTLSRRFVTLAEHLREEGYATAAWCPNPSLNSVFGYDQGFAHYDDQILNDDPALPVWRRFETAKRMNRRFLAWVEENGDRPWFAYLHYRDTHFPYAPPPAYDRMYYRRRPGERALRPVTAAEYALQPSPGRMAVGDETDLHDLAYYIAQYDAEIRYTDDQIAILLAALEKAGRLANTWIVVTADHGEGFLEHGRWNHGNVLYDEACHVPLVIVPPRPPPGGKRIPAPVHTFDASRTILDLAGVEPKGHLQAKSLLPLLEGKGDPPWTHAYVEKKQRSVLRGPRWKYLLDTGRGRQREELYDLRNDPGERRNVAASHPGLVGELRKRVRAIRRLNEELAREVDVGSLSLTKKQKDDLRALGYLK